MNAAHAPSAAISSNQPLGALPELSDGLKNLVGTFAILCHTSNHTLLRFVPNRRKLPGDVAVTTCFRLCVELATLLEERDPLVIGGHHRGSANTSLSEILGSLHPCAVGERPLTGPQVYAGQRRSERRVCLPRERSVGHGGIHLAANRMD